MSREFPEHIDELSRYALEEAIDTVSRAVADAPEDVRRAAAVIRLVTGVPRRVPWYGVPVDPEDNSVTAGVMVRSPATWSSGTRRRVVFRFIGWAVSQGASRRLRKLGREACGYNPSVEVPSRGRSTPVRAPRHYGDLFA
jgi:hypothetical protein